jgi:hypothetical protein
MDVRLITEDDYNNVLIPWWEFWRFGAPAFDMLPINGGVMLSEDGVDICAGFIYLTNSKAAWVEWIVSNPEIKDRGKRKHYLLTLINTLTRVAKDKGNKYIYTSLRNQSLMNLYSEAGYQMGSKNCQEMIKVL